MAIHQVWAGHSPETGILRCFAKTKNLSTSTSCGLFRADYLRLPLSLRMVEEMLAARGIEVSHETVRQWALKFGQSYADQIRRLPASGDKWHLDEVVISIPRRIISHADDAT